IAPGGEVRVDERIPQLLRDDLISTLGDTKKYLLLELPTSIAIDAAAVLQRLDVSASGVSLILAHAERCESLVKDPALAEQGVQRGVALQVNAGGLLGAFGPDSATAAIEWLRHGWVSLIATDAHSVGTRRPRMSDAIEFVVEHFGEQMARCVCLENPLRVLQG